MGKAGLTLNELLLLGFPLERKLNRSGVCLLALRECGSCALLNISFSLFESLIQ